MHRSKKSRSITSQVQIVLGQNVISRCVIRSQMSEAKKSKAKKSWAITCKVQNVMGPIMLSQSVARSIMSGTKRLWPKCNPGQSEYIEDAKGNIFMEQKMWFGLVLARFGYKMTFLHLLNKSRGFHTWFFQITTPNIICAGTFLLSRETFFCRNLKNARMSFLGQCNVETASCHGF